MDIVVNSVHSVSLSVNCSLYYQGVLTDEKTASPAYFFRRKVYLPCESQPKGNSDEEWMLGAIGLYSTAISKIVEHVGFKV